MKWSQDIDHRVKYVLEKEAEKMQEEDYVHYKIREQIYIKGGEKKMKIRKMSRKSILVGIMTIVLATGTILATSISGWDMKLLNVYKKFPTQEQIEERNFSPKFVEELPDGYTFMMASKHKGELIDEYNQISDEGNEFILRYFAPEEDQHAIVFFATDIVQHYGNNIVKTIEEYKGITLEFTDWKVKYVAGEYKATEEEQKQIDEGVFFMRETEDEYLLEKDVDHKQQISWWEDGIGYSLLSANNHQFTQEDFVEMAKVIIDSK